MNTAFVIAVVVLSVFVGALALLGAIVLLKVFMSVIALRARLGQLPDQLKKRQAWLNHQQDQLVKAQRALAHDKAQLKAEPIKPEGEYGQDPFQG